MSKCTHCVPGKEKLCSVELMKKKKNIQQEHGRNLQHRARKRINPFYKNIGEVKMQTEVFRWQNENEGFSFSQHAQVHYHGRWWIYCVWNVSGQNAGEDHIKVLFNTKVGCRLQEIPELQVFQKNEILTLIQKSSVSICHGPFLKMG